MKNARWVDVMGGLAFWYILIQGSVVLKKYIPVTSWDFWIIILCFLMGAVVQYVRGTLYEKL